MYIKSTNSLVGSRIMFGCLRIDHDAEKCLGTCLMSCSIMELCIGVERGVVLELVIFLVFLSGSIFATFGASRAQASAMILSLKKYRGMHDQQKHKSEIENGENS